MSHKLSLSGILSFILVISSALYFSRFSASNNSIAPKVYAGSDHHDNNHKVTICHATGSNTNPYNEIEVDDDAVDGDGRSDHNRRDHQDGEDIIPSGYWDHDGRNWDSEGRAIYNNHCNIPHASASASASSSPSVSPSVSPSPSASSECSPSLSPSPSPSASPEASEEPVVSPSPSPVASDEPIVSPSPEASVSPSPEPSNNPSPSPSSTPAPSNNNSNNDNNNNSNNSNNDSGNNNSNSDNQGEVLGAYAATGIVEDSLFAIMNPIGGVMTLAGTILYGQKKNRKNKK